MYLNHLKRNFTSHIFYFVIFLLATVILLLVYGSIISRKFKIYRNIKSYDYSFAVESKNSYEDYYDFFKVESLVSVVNSSNKLINVNLYVPINDKKSSITHDDINYGEIVISEKIAKNLNVNIGDNLLLSLSIYDKPQEFIIKDIILYLDDLYDFKDDFDFSVAIINLNQETINKFRGIYVGLLTQEQYEKFMNNSVGYNYIYDVDNEIDVLKDQFVIDSVILVVTLLTLFIGYIFLINKVLYSEFDKYYLDGFSLKKIEKIILLDKLVYCLITVILLILIMMIACLVRLLNIILVLICSIVLISVAVLYLMIGKKYEKVSRV